MIKFKHPLEECNIQQEKFLSSCPADQRRFHELILTHGNITFCYHMLSKDYKPNEKDWLEWLEGLSNNLRDKMKEKGFEECKGILSFTRYILEKNDIGMEEYIKMNMDEEDYKEYMSLSKRD